MTDIGGGATFSAGDVSFWGNRSDLFSHESCFNAEYAERFRAACGRGCGLSLDE